MKDRPILFSAPMVRALLDGSKTQTRRVMKAQPPSHVVDFCTYHNPKGDGLAHFGFDPVARELQEWFAVCPYGQPGDRLWVRETWRPNADGGFEYKADGGPMQSAFKQIFDDLLKRKWKPSIHMPRGASRITMDITGVRIEQLHDITETDAKAEGLTCHHGLYATPDQVWQIDPRKAYRDLWESINGPESWEANPFVWVIEFKKVTAL